MKPLVQKLTQDLARIDDAMARLGIEQKKLELVHLMNLMSANDFWDDPEAAQKISREANQLSNTVKLWISLRDDTRDLIELADLGDGAEESEITSQYEKLHTQLESALVTLKLSGQYDTLPAIVQISAGVGGTDAQDWAQMLLEMYTKYCEKSGLSADIVDISRGEEAGIKSATLVIDGEYAFGKLKSEKGVHRLVRISPFNAQNLRQTSFALVDVVPQIAESEIELDPSDLRIDVYRASGHGGQSVNTTDSAVRITHIPTGIVVAIQNERSQLKNKQRALSILASKLAEAARAQHKASVSELRGKLKSADWGAQIRSYVLHPYTKVKDHRTDFETSDAQGVLGGEIEPFIEAYLSHSIKE